MSTIGLEEHLRQERAKDREQRRFELFKTALPICMAYPIPQANNLTPEELEAVGIRAALRITDAALEAFEAQGENDGKD